MWNKLSPPIKIVLKQIHFLSIFLPNWAFLARFFFQNFQKITNVGLCLFRTVELLRFIQENYLKRGTYLLVTQIFILMNLNNWLTNLDLRLKNQLEQDKMVFLKSRVACSIEFICNFSKVCYFLGFFFQSFKTYQQRQFFFHSSILFKVKQVVLCTSFVF